ncbi:transcriptional regulator YeiL [Anaerolentibacter hominis]|uniref:transcriptional regulator YeiL n=1 Tax=Anaerolentibacter hominis TaxID=3079009 RepID=UPI0031B894E4
MKELSVTDSVLSPGLLSELFSFDVLPFTKLVQFESGETIFHEGDEVTTLYYLIEGRAKLYLTQKNGKVSLVNFLDAPCFLGEMELLGAQSCTNGIQALFPCTCLALQLYGCRDRLLNDNRFLRCLSLFLGRRALQNTDHFIRNQAWPLKNRLARFILTASHTNLYREKHTEAAEYLGVTYRHLLYVLTQFCQEGILLRKKIGYLILRRDLLTEYAGAME